MKSLVTALSALPLSFVLTSIAAAQKATEPNTATESRLPDRPGTMASAAPSQLSALPVAEAKKRYLATQQRLQNLAQGGWKFDKAPVNRRETNLVTEITPRDQLREAVAEDFDARRQLQQAELAELEARVARIKRALAIRDAMRDTVIDQRTDELLDQLEEGGESGKR